MMHDKLNQIMEELSSKNECTWLAVCAGRYDLISIL
jgi:hypothetical protein